MVQRPAAVQEDRVKDIFHGAAGDAVAARKRELDKKRSYGAELQAQMRAAAERKEQEKLERRGPLRPIVPAVAPPPLQAAYATGTGQPGGPEHGAGSPHGSDRYPAAQATYQYGPSYGTGGLYQSSAAEAASYSGPRAGDAWLSGATGQLGGRLPPPAFQQGYSPTRQSGGGAGGGDAYAYPSGHSGQGPVGQQQQQQQQQRHFDPYMGDAHPLPPPTYGPGRTSYDSYSHAGGGDGMLRPDAGRRQGSQDWSAQPAAGSYSGYSGGGYPITADHHEPGPPSDTARRMSMQGAYSGTAGPYGYQQPQQPPQQQYDSPARQQYDSPPRQQYDPPAQQQYASPPQLAAAAGGGGGGPVRGSPAVAAGPRPADAAEAARAEAARQRREAYRLELEAQMRDKKVREQREKAQRMNEDVRKEAEIAAYNPWGKGGCGAPLKGGNGQTIADLSQTRGYHQAREREQPTAPAAAAATAAAPAAAASPWQPAASYNAYPAPGTAAAPAAAAAPWQPTASYNAFSAPEPHYEPHYEPQAFSADQNPPGFTGGSAQPGGPSPGGGEARGGPVVINFRSDNMYATPADVDRKAAAAKELQSALAAQIQEKQRAKEARERAEKEQELRDMARVQRDLELQQAAFQAQQQKEAAAKEAVAAGTVDVVAEAWSKAKQESKLERRKSQVMVSMSGSLHANTGTLVQHTPRPALAAGPPPQPQQQQQQLPSQQDTSTVAHRGEPSGSQQRLDGGVNGSHQDDAARVTGLSSTSFADEKQRRAAHQELSLLRAEMAQEAAQLREEVFRQNDEVLALRQKAAHMEAESARAKQQLHRIQMDMMRRSQEQPELLSAIMSDYAPHSSTVLQPPYTELHLNLDLPPATTVARRANGTVGATAATATMGMGGAGFGEPQMGRGARSSRPHHAEPAGRPVAPVSARRHAPNTLEMSMAAESTLIFPSGGSSVGGAAGGGTAPPGESSTTEALGSYPYPPNLQYARASSSAPGLLLETTGSSRSQLQPDNSLRRRSTSANRNRLGTPLDVHNLHTVNENKLKMLSSITTNNDLETLDEFLLKFANGAGQSSMHQKPATPLIKIPTPQSHSRPTSGRYFQEGGSSLSQSGYSHGAAGAATAAAGRGYSRVQGMSDALDLEMQGLQLTSAGPGSSPYKPPGRGTDSMLAQGYGAGGLYRQPSQGHGSTGVHGQYISAVKAGDVSLMSSTQWMPNMKQ